MVAGDGFAHALDHLLELLTVRVGAVADSRFDGQHLQRFANLEQVTNVLCVEFDDVAGVRLGDDQTLVVATHRHNMLSILDRLIVIDAGRIIADGPRDEVLGKMAKPAKGRAA